MKYGPRSKLRRACSRFLRFAYLLDFVAMDALTNIYTKSVIDTLARLETLSDAPVDLKLQSKEALVGGQRGVVSAKYAPFFAITAKFLGNEIRDIP